MSRSFYDDINVGRHYLKAYCWNGGSKRLKEANAAEKAGG